MRTITKKDVGNVTKMAKLCYPKYTKYVAKKFECQCSSPVLK